MTTKEQERKALSQIKKIIEGLGEDSYLATAFKGCFDDAEENIKNDFALSMYDRWQMAEYKADTLAAEIAELKTELDDTKKDYEAAHAAAHEIAEEKNAEIAELRQHLEDAKAKVLPGWLYKGLHTAIESELSEHKERLEELADSMAAHAEHPESAAFRNAVAYYLVRKEQKEICEQTLQGLEFVEP